MIGAGRKIIERATGNVYIVDFIIDASTAFGFEQVVKQRYRDRDIVCDYETKVFRPEEIEFVDTITTETWRAIVEQLKKWEQEKEEALLASVLQPSSSSYTTPS